MNLPVEQLPLGVPLTGEVLGAMGEEERTFWRGFLGEIDELRDGEMPDLLNPLLPEGLLAQYRIAVERYGGLQYCQVLQIKQLYNLG
jgi:hypothetical protein